MTLKENILKLHLEGKYPFEISKILKCSCSTVRYYVIPGEKERRNSKMHHRKRKMQQLKIDFGGKCSICGYDKCLDALHFHHNNKENKITCVSHAMYNGIEKAKEEAKKCELICANCHAELHYIPLKN